MRHIDGLKETIARTKQQPLAETVKKEPPSLKMTTAQTPLLIREVQKDLPLEQQMFSEDELKEVEKKIEEAEKSETVEMEIVEQSQDVSDAKEEQKTSVTESDELKDKTTEVTTTISDKEKAKYNNEKMVYPPKVSSCL